MFTLETFVLVKCTYFLSEYLMCIEALAFAYFHLALLALLCFALVHSWV